MSVECQKCGRKLKKHSFEEITECVRSLDRAHGAKRMAEMEARLAEFPPSPKKASVTVEMIANALLGALGDEIDSHGMVYIEIDTLTSVKNGNKTNEDMRLLRILSDVIDKLTRLEQA